MNNLKLLVFIFSIIPTLLLADVSKHIIDSETKLVGWKLDQAGLELELNQLLPNQTRAFFQARGFSVKHANDIATGCIYQTIVRNKADKPITILLKQWQIKTRDGTEQPIKLKEVWDSEWNDISQAARIAFRWSTFPTEQTFTSASDSNWGMISFGLNPGISFDLHIFWQLDHELQDIWIKDMQCPTD
ncbi:MAG: hypothetical protein QM487_11220 [Candidatus Marithrix sp.]